MNLKELQEIGEVRCKIEHVIHDNHGDRWIASLNAEVTPQRDSGILTSAVGFGDTERQATLELIKFLRGKILVTRVGQFKVPKTLVA
jgi:hypothetical protein